MTPFCVGVPRRTCGGRPAAVGVQISLSPHLKCNWLAAAAMPFLFTCREKLTTDFSTRAASGMNIGVGKARQNRLHDSLERAAWSLGWVARIYTLGPKSPNDVVWSPGPDDRGSRGGRVRACGLNLLRGSSATEEQGDSAGNG